MSAGVTGFGWDRGVGGGVEVGMTDEKKLRPRLMPAPRCEPEPDRGPEEDRGVVDWLAFFRDRTTESGGFG